MLASTVQFSNNDQPPITPGRIRSSLGPATEESPFPQIPNSVPDTLASPSRVPRRSSTSDQSRSSVPSSQRSTHEQPVRDVRSHAGL
jgi:hypothetical protein